MIEAWRRSGEPRPVFARRHGWTSNRIEYWPKRLSRAEEPAPTLALVPATVVARVDRGDPRLRSDDRADERDTESTSGSRSCTRRRAPRPHRRHHSHTPTRARCSARRAPRAIRDRRSDPKGAATSGVDQPARNGGDRSVNFTKPVSSSLTRTESRWVCCSRSPRPPELPDRQENPGEGTQCAHHREMTSTVTGTTSSSRARRCADRATYPVVRP